MAATPLLGREVDVAAICELLEAGNAVVTVLGPGGIGKTRLAAAAARQFAAAHHQPAIFVDLTLCGSASDSRRLLADLLRTEPSGIRASLRSSRMLIVVDNAEHLLDETAALVEELIQEPGVLALVTSRSPLGLTQERRFELDGLEAGGLGSPGVQLLAERAGFSAVEATASAPQLQLIAERCDGIPLVMELLGSALQWESPADLLARIGSDLDSIHDRSRNRSQRHVSIGAAVDWSVDRASPDARAALGALATIRGQFSASTAVEMIAGMRVPGEREVLAELVDLSLVKRIRDPGRIAFRMLEPIRLHAESLEPADRESRLRVHADVYLRQLAEVHTHYVESTADFDRLMSTEGPNLARAAETRWRHDPERAVDEIAPLLYGWFERDRGSEVVHWADVILGSEFGGEVARAKVRISLMLTLLGYSIWEPPDVGAEVDELSTLVEATESDLDDEWQRRWCFANFTRWVNVEDVDRARDWARRIRPGSAFANGALHAGLASIHRLRGEWREALAEVELVLAIVDVPVHSGLRVGALSERGFLKAILGDTSAEKDLLSSVELAAQLNLGFEDVLAKLNLAFLYSQDGRAGACLALCLDVLEWSGSDWASHEAAAFAALALHARGEDLASASLATLIANSEAPAAARFHSGTRLRYLKPYWDALISELPPLTSDESGFWDISGARAIIATALERFESAKPQS